MKFLYVAVVLMFYASPIALAATVPLAGEQASVDLPDTWTAQPQQADPSAPSSSLVLSALNAEKNAMLQVQVFPNPHAVMAAQPDFVAKIKDNISNQIVSHGGQVQFTSEGPITIHDVPAYQIQYTAKPQSPSSPSLMGRNYLIAANGKLYLITLRTVDAGADADLQAIANSFHFDSPPTLPTPQVAGHRIRYYLAAAGGVVVLVALGAGFYYYRQRQLYE